LRLIRLRCGRRTTCLLTDLREESEFSEQQAGVLYRMRWGVETFFRGFKRTLQNHKLRSHNPENAVRELQ
jgi:IS4 transposase